MEQLPEELVNKIIMMSRPKPIIRRHDIWYSGKNKGIDFYQFAHRKYFGDKIDELLKDGLITQEKYDDICEYPQMVKDVDILKPYFDKDGIHEWWDSADFKLGWNR